MSVVIKYARTYKNSWVFNTPLNLFRLHIFPMLKRVLLSVLFLLIIVIGAAFGAYQWTLSQALTLPEDGVVFEVNKGETLHSVLARLKQKDYLAQTWSARLYAKQHELASQIKYGEFELPSDTTLASLFSLLTSNQQISYKITLIEGSTFAEARAVIKASNKIRSLWQDKSDSEVLALLKEKSAGLEGYQATSHPEGMLYPDTYYFHKGDTDASVLLRAHQRLVAVLKEEWGAREKALPLVSAYEALILASIVEKETGKPEERSEIAGVFVRRLNKKMRLQTDPTVIYGLGDHYQGNITRKHLKALTPYNTYRINGLPPTPIALVGRDAIHATLHPKAGESLYFVAKGDGSHQFSATISAHNRAVRKYQLKRRSDYRSSHQTVK